jgi:hypothetical protein
LNRQSTVADLCGLVREEFIRTLEGIWKEIDEINPRFELPAVSAPIELPAVSAPIELPIE